MDEKSTFEELQKKARERFGKVIGNRVREHRKHRNCTQEAIATQIGCHRNLIVQIEKGIILPPLDTLYVILNGIEQLHRLPRKYELNWRRAFSDFFKYDRPMTATTEENDRAEQLHEQLEAIISAKNERDVAAVAHAIENQYNLMLLSRARASPHPEAG